MIWYAFGTVSLSAVTVATIDDDSADGSCACPELSLGGVAAVADDAVAAGTDAEPDPGAGVTGKSAGGAEGAALFCFTAASSSL